tara:strand:+ start:5978 stop:6433 length:456 start_codon:yes stop_codon:yes gene_type:complete
LKIIAHRGNLNGPDLKSENKLDSIQECIDLNFDVEIDLWLKDNQLFLGHDFPQYEVDYDWLINRASNLWIHCKNLQAFSYIAQTAKLNFFWHQKDDYTLTSKGIIWAYPGQKTDENCIVVMPESFMEMRDLKLLKCFGICTDYPIRASSLI